jgi:hypothetical protein
MRTVAALLLTTLMLLGWSAAVHVPTPAALVSDETTPTWSSTTARTRKQRGVPSGRWCGGAPAKMLPWRPGSKVGLSVTHSRVSAWLHGPYWLSSIEPCFDSKNNVVKSANPDPRPQPPPSSCDAAAGAAVAAGVLAGVAARETWKLACGRGRVPWTLAARRQCNTPGPSPP